MHSPAVTVRSAGIIPRAPDGQIGDTVAVQVAKRHQRPAEAIAIGK
jgi:hypothetical protein